MRTDLSAGQQITQTAHAVADYTAMFPDAAAQWRDAGNSLIVVGVDTVRELHRLTGAARRRGLDVAVFSEPDLCGERTAAAVGASPGTWRMLSELGLAGKVSVDAGDVERAARTRERRLRVLSEQMRDCEQMPGLDVLAHGEVVCARFVELADHIQYDVALESEWRLPTWIERYRGVIDDDIGDRFEVERYLVVHDCGKPSVRTVDDDGRQHFPGHATASAAVWAATTGAQPDDRIVALIGSDMDAHTLTGDGVAEFARRTDAIVSLLAAVAEVHANAEMFGGVTSSGFKMKLKHLERRGRAVCAIRYPDVT